MLKLAKSPSALHLMKSRMSGWSTRSTPMFAPRRVPPCLTASVAWLKTRMNETGPARDALRRAHLSRRPGRSREKREAGAAAGLVDERGVAHRAEDRLHRVLDRQDEARGELLQLAAGVHQRRRVRQELERGHQVVEVRAPPRRRAASSAPHDALGRGDVLGDADEHVRRLLDGVALLVLAQVALLQHLERVRAQDLVDGARVAGRACGLGHGVPSPSDNRSPPTAMRRRSSTTYCGSAIVDAPYIVRQRAGRRAAEHSRRTAGMPLDGNARAAARHADGAARQRSAAIGDVAMTS